MIFLMRHGEIFRGKKFIGQTDIPLAEMGEKQIGAWRPYFQTLNLKGLYCSELERSFCSARIIGKSVGIPPHACPELNEINLGDWDGKEMSEIRAVFSEEWEARGRNIDTFCPRGGESFIDLSLRVMPFFEKLIFEHQKNDILILGHAGVNRVILCHILGMPIKNLFKLDQDYACLNIIEANQKSCRLKRMNMGCYEKSL